MLLCVVASSTFYDVLVSLQATYISDSGELLDHTVHEQAPSMTGSRGNTSWSKDSTLSLHNCSVMSSTFLLLCIWREARRNKGGVDPLAVAVSRHLAKDVGLVEVACCPADVAQKD